MTNWEQWLGYLILMVRGAGFTLVLTTTSCLFGFLIAVIAGVCRLSRHAPVRWVVATYVEFFRGTSIYVQLFWIFYVLPLLGISLAALQAGILALSLNAGAYGSELVRAAMQSIPREQHEACVALNLTRWQSMRHVLFPQAFMVMLPLFGNLAIEVMKMTAIVSLITIADLTFVAQTVRVQTGNTAFPYITALLLYFILASVIDRLFKLLERHYSRGHEGLRA